MKYRRLGKTGVMLSEIGFGGEYVDGTPYSNVEKVMHTAMDGGVNIIDCFMSAPTIRSDMGNAIGARRKDIYLQGHIGAVFENNQYLRSMDVKKCDEYLKDFLTRFHTDYIDFGMIHFIDNEEQFCSAFETDYIEYVLKLKCDGVIRFIGASSHDPVIAAKVVETGLVDMIMFSINPAFDMQPTGTSIEDLFMNIDTPTAQDRFAIDPDRARLYRLCEERDIGITVMKALGAGRLLRAESSPFEIALTPAQCIHYALTRPAAVSAIIGAKTVSEMEAALAYEQASEKERDYSAISRGTRWSISGKCMYCNHCLPCVSEIDIASVTKYLDMQQERGGALPSAISEHYASLSKKAGDCIECGVCEKNCPFHVPVIENMRLAKHIFGA